MNKKDEIQQFLNKIEEEHQIVIISAIESGSRAWGFPSKDSDYDIRLIYHHPKDWYLSAFKKRNVIENIFYGDLDAAGWDITKCMQLLYKGNAPLYEWLHSPIIYRQHDEKLRLLRELALKAFNPKLSFYHYISLAKRKLLEEKTRHNPKSFLYALRALLCAQWLAENKSIPPVEFQCLVTRYIKDAETNSDLSTLINNKLNLLENDNTPLNKNLWNYAEHLFLQLKEEKIPVSGLKETKPYDEILLKILQLL